MVETDLLVKFGYRETAPRRAARLWWQRLNLRHSREQDPNSRSLWAAQEYRRDTSSPAACGGYLPDELSRICETMVAPNKWTGADQRRTDDSSS